MRLSVIVRHFCICYRYVYINTYVRVYVTSGLFVWSYRAVHRGGSQVWPINIVLYIPSPRAVCTSCDLPSQEHAPRVRMRVRVRVIGNIFSDSPSCVTRLPSILYSCHRILLEITSHVYIVFFWNIYYYNLFEISIIIIMYYDRSQFNIEIDFRLRRSLRIINLKLWIITKCSIDWDIESIFDKCLSIRFFSIRNKMRCNF